MAGEGLDEDYAGGRLRTRGVETLDADWHCGKRVEVFERRECRRLCDIESRSSWNVEERGFLDVWQVDAVARDAKSETLT